jgi:3-oxoacyl-[acyl-carrier protein] reductase
MPRVAVITGASRGIGAATARVLTERGFRVVVNYRSSATEATEVVADIAAAGGEALAIKADVTVPHDVAAMFADTEQRWGRVEVVVHNALIPYDTADGRVDLDVAGRGIDAIAAELGVASIAADAFYAPAQ